MLSEGLLLQGTHKCGPHLAATLRRFYAAKQRCVIAVNLGFCPATGLTSIFSGQNLLASTCARDGYQPASHCIGQCRLAEQRTSSDKKWSH